MSIGKRFGLIIILYPVWFCVPAPLAIPYLDIYLSHCICVMFVLNNSLVSVETRTLLFEVVPTIEPVRVPNCSEGNSYLD